MLSMDSVRVVEIHQTLSITPKTEKCFLGIWLALSFQRPALVQGNATVGKTYTIMGPIHSMAIFAEWMFIVLDLFVESLARFLGTFECSQYVERSATLIFITGLATDGCRGNLHHIHNLSMQALSPLTVVWNRWPMVNIRTTLFFPSRLTLQFCLVLVWRKRDREIKFITENLLLMQKRPLSNVLRRIFVARRLPNEKQRENISTVTIGNDTIPISRVSVSDRNLRRPDGSSQEFPDRRSNTQIWHEDGWLRGSRAQIDRMIEEHSERKNYIDR